MAQIHMTAEQQPVTLKRHGNPHELGASQCDDVVPASAKPGAGTWPNAGPGSAPRRGLGKGRVGSRDGDGDADGMMITLKMTIDN